MPSRVIRALLGKRALLDYLGGGFLLTLFFKSFPRFPNHFSRGSPTIFFLIALSRIAPLSFTLFLTLYFSLFFSPKRVPQGPNLLIPPPRCAPDHTIGPEGTKALADALKINRTLHTIDLGSMAYALGGDPFDSPLYFFDANNGFPFFIHRFRNPRSGLCFMIIVSN